MQRAAYVSILDALLLTLTQQDDANGRGPGSLVRNFGKLQFYIVITYNSVVERHIK